jgi:pyridoxine kinase
MKRIATIQDISCFGKCSLTVALPLISAMGVECAVVPTAVLSTHTGGFSGYTFRDLTDDIPAIEQHWKSCDLHFDALYTGYLGSARQIELMCHFFDTFKDDNTLLFVDPAMADNGRMYTGFDDSFALEMAKLCRKAHIIVPNMTEATKMLGEKFISSGYGEDYVHGLLRRLHQALGCPTVVLTGVVLGDRHGAVAYDSATDSFIGAFHDHIPVSFHGTGDTFSSILVGALTRGIPMARALQIAVDFTHACMVATLPEREKHAYGVKFEECIPLLVSLCKEQ